MKKTSILFVDSNPLAIKGFEISLKSLESDYSFEIDSACDYDQVLAKMKRASPEFFEIVFLDISLPASINQSYINGENIGLLIRRKHPETKIVAHIYLGSELKIINVFKLLKPEGLIIKSDLDTKVLRESVLSILNGNIYYSKNVNIFETQKKDKVFLDLSDQKILYYLSKGEMMKNLPKHVPLSMATIERRKRKIKAMLNIPEASDMELFEVARKSGFL